MSEQPTPDTKDWTVVLGRTCPECGIDVRALDPDRIAGLVRAATGHFTRALAAPGARDRPRPGVWSTHEYCAHVAEMYRVMHGRLMLIIGQDAPEFTDWDQDEAAVLGGYARLPAAKVARMLEDSAQGFAAALEALTDAQKPRMGTRSNGAVFTVATLAQYAWHDAAHHLHHDLGVPGSTGREADSGATADGHGTQGPVADGTSPALAHALRPRQPAGAVPAPTPREFPRLLTSA